MKRDNVIRFLVICLLFICVGFVAGCAQKKQPEPAPVVVQEPTFIDHAVKYSGETLALISLWYTKESNNWHAILAANPGLDVKRMNIGQVIKIPYELVKEKGEMPRSFVGRAMKKKEEAVATTSTTQTLGEVIDSASGQQPPIEDSKESQALPDTAGGVMPNQQAVQGGAPTDSAPVGNSSVDGSVTGAIAPKTPPAWVDPATQTWGSHPVAQPQQGNEGSSSSATADRSKLLDELLQ